MAKMKNVLLLIAAMLIPVGAAQGKLSRYSTQLGPTYCLIDSGKCLCGDYDNLGNGCANVGTATAGSSADIRRPYHLGVDDDEVGCGYSQKQFKFD
jgi:hypothetical protein